MGEDEQKVSLHLSLFHDLRYEKVFSSINNVGKKSFGKIVDPYYIRITVVYYNCQAQGQFMVIKKPLWRYWKKDHENHANHKDRTKTNYMRYIIL